MNDLIPSTPEKIRKTLKSVEEKIAFVPDSVSEFQIRRFIVGSEHSDLGRLRQCIVEMRSRATSLEKGYINRERVNLDIEEIEGTEIDSENHIAIKRKGLDLLEKEIELREVERGIGRLERELSILVDTLSELAEMDINTSEEEYWEERLRRKIAINLALNQPLSMNLIESVLNMPEHSEIRKWMEDTLIKPQEEEDQKDHGQ